MAMHRLSQILSHTLLLISFPALVFAQSVTTGGLTIDPAEPEAGDTVRFTYDATASDSRLDATGPLFLVPNYPWSIEEKIPMERSSAGWVAEFTFHSGDVSGYMPFHIEDASEATDDNGGAYYEVFMVEDGSVVENAYRTRGRHFAGLLPEDATDEERDAITLENLEHELTAHPDNVSAQMQIWRIQLEQGADPAPIRAEAKRRAEKLVADDPESLEAYLDALGVYRSVDLYAHLDALELTTMRVPPNDAFRAHFELLEFGRRFVEESDSDSKTDWLKEVIERWADQPTTFGEYTVSEYYTVDVLWEVIEANDVAGILEIADDAIDSRWIETTDDIAQMAVIVARHGGDLDQARRLAGVAADNSSLRYDRSFVVPTSFNPLRVRVIRGKEEEAAAFRARVDAEMRLVSAYIDAKDGQTAAALRVVNEVDETVAESGDMRLLIAEIRSMAGRHDQAVQDLRELLSESPWDDDIRLALTEAWTSKNGSQDGLIAALMEIEDAWRTEQRAGLAEDFVGDEAPAFDVTLLSSEGTVTNDDLAGQVAVIQFWNTTCLYCARELPAFERAAREYRTHEDVSFIAVNTTESDTIDKARQFVALRDYTVPFAFSEDSEMAENFESNSYGLVILDRDGRIAFRRGGYYGEGAVEQLSVQIDYLLDGNGIVTESLGSE